MVHRLGAMPGIPSVSVAICTRDRPDDLKRALASVTSQDFDGYEVLVVDQSTSERTRGIVEEARATFPSITYVKLGTPGLSRAYNSALGSARGALIAFTDDDCIAPPGWLASIARAFEKQPAIGLLYGQVLLPPELKDREGAEGVTPQLIIERRRILSRRDGFRVFGMGANFAARRSACIEIGGFDEVLGGGGPLQSAQDFDFAYRLYRAGWAILLEPGVAVFHHGFRSAEDWPGVVRSYGIGVGGFYWKHVRAGDAYAARLLGAMLLRETAGVMRKLVRRRAAGIQWKYVTSVCAGIGLSHTFDVDSSRRLYANRRRAARPA